VAADGGPSDGAASGKIIIQDVSTLRQGAASGFASNPAQSGGAGNGGLLGQQYTLHETEKTGLQSWPDLKNVSKKLRVPLPPHKGNPSNLVSALSGSSKKSSARRAANIPGLNKPEELAGISLRQLQSLTVEDLSSKFGELAENYGYHNTMVKLESSPLFQTYINTGTKLLDEDLTFEQLQEKSKADYLKYLSRSEFEKFADFLMKIQAA
jgi:hypothetical protein